MKTNKLTVGQSVRSIAVIICLAFGFPGLSWADDAHVLDVIQSQSAKGQLLVSGRIRGAFSREIIKTIESGAPLTFTYFLRVERVRPIFWDGTKQELVIKRTVRYDTLKKEYLIWEKQAEDEDDIDFEAEMAALDIDRGKTKPEATASETPQTEPKTPPAKLTLLHPEVIKEFADLERWMTRLENIDMGNIDQLSLNGIYRASIRCEMKSIRLIPPFNIILFFVAIWDFDTDWAYSAPFMIKERKTPAPEEPEPVAAPVSDTANPIKP